VIKDIVEDVFAGVYDFPVNEFFFGHSPVSIWKLAANVLWPVMPLPVV
jgi:hypothetical protein